MNTEQRPESELLWLFGPYSQLLEDREQHGRGRRCWVPGKQNQKRFHIQDSKSKLIIGMGEARAGPGPCELRPNSELLGKPQWPKGWRICLQCRRPVLNPWVRKIPWRWEGLTYSSILAWKIPWTEDAGGLQSMESQKVRNNWALCIYITNTYICTNICTA